MTEYQGNTASMGGVVRGKVRVVQKGQYNSLQDGEVLVTEMTDPDMVPMMRRAKAIITFVGGRTCHAAIVSRELGVPCIVACKGAMALQTGMEVEVDTTGMVGKVRRV